MSIKTIKIRDVTGKWVMIERAIFLETAHDVSILADFEFCHKLGIRISPSMILNRFNPVHHEIASSIDPISILGLLARGQKAMELCGINTIGDLSTKYVIDFLRIQGFGRKSLAELQNALHQYCKDKGII